MAPWEEEEDAMREFFVCCKTGERKRTLCDNGILLVARVGRGRGHWARRGLLLVYKLGYLWPVEPIQPLLRKLLKLIQI
jgi:hypothetical protein